MVSCAAWEKVSRSSACCHAHQEKSRDGYCMVSCTVWQKVGRGIACCQAQHDKRSGGILHAVMHSMVKDRDGYCMLSCAAWQKLGREMHVVEMDGGRGNLV